MNIEDIRTRIRKHYQGLSKNQKKIADYFIENSDKIPFMSVHEIAKTTGASVATVVRFSQSVGFSGFSDIRVAVADSIQDKLQNNEKFPLINDSDLNNLLVTVANQDINNINETLQIINADEFKEAVVLINSAHRVYTAGLGISYLLSQILAYQLMQVGIDATCYNHNFTTFLEQALLAEKDDLLIVLSFPPYSTETIELAKAMHEKGIKVITITNKPAAPASFYADKTLIVKSKNLLYTNSIAAISVLINAISTECAMQNRDKAEQMIIKLEEISKDITIPE